MIGVIYDRAVAARPRRERNNLILPLARLARVSLLHLGLSAFISALYTRIYKAIRSAGELRARVRDFSRANRIQIFRFPEGDPNRIYRILFPLGFFFVLFFGRVTTAIGRVISLSFAFIERARIKFSSDRP